MKEPKYGLEFTIYAVLLLRLIGDDIIWICVVLLGHLVNKHYIAPRRKRKDDD